MQPPLLIQGLYLYSLSKKGYNRLYSYKVYIYTVCLKNANVLYKVYKRFYLFKIVVGYRVPTAESLLRAFYHIWVPKLALTEKVLEVTTRTVEEYRLNIVSAYKINARTFSRQITNISYLPEQTQDNEYKNYYTIQSYT